MKRLKKLSLLVIIAFSFFGLSACNNSEQPAQPLSQGGLIGQPAPDFSLTDIHGNQVSLSQYKGQVVVLNFWATWCPPCREEMPSMEKLHRDYQDKGLVMLAVNVDKNPQQAVADFLRERPYSFTILLDSQNVAQNTYGVFRFPESFIIDRNGIVVEKIIGARDWLTGPTFKLIDFLING